MMDSMQRDIAARAAHAPRDSAAFPRPARSPLIVDAAGGTWFERVTPEATSANRQATTVEREELNRLRRENRQLKLEREILSKAAACFARETDVIPPKGSNS